MASPLAKPSAPAAGKMRLVRELLGPYHRWLALILAMMLVETAMSVASPWPLKIILDNVVGDHKPAAWLDALRFLDLGGDKMELAAVAGAAVVVIALLGAVASYIDNYYTESVSQWVAHDLRMRVYDHLHRLSLGYYDTHQSGPILSTLTADVKTIQGFASSGTLGILVDLLTIVGMVGIMFWLDWDFALIAIGATPFLLLFVARFNKEVKAATHEVRRYQSDIVAVVQQGLESMRIVKAFGRQELEKSQLAEVSHATVEAALAARRVKSLLSPAVSLTVALCTGYVLWRGTGLVLADVMTLGALTVFLTYLSKFFKPVQDLAKMSNTIAQTAVAIERIQVILDTDDILPVKPDARDPGTLRGEISFENVAFSYTPESTVLTDVVCHIAPGQLVGVVGPTGGGKSTVVSMIPRFYDPSGGTVRIDGVDVRDFDLQALRRQVGFVLQDTSLFHGTIRDNIAYGRPGATDQEIVEAARLANADEFISRMAHGYDTMVGERGMTLSGGQRQRIGIARAIVRNAPILILDEPTAALDTESEKLVIDALEKLMEGRTVITIAHRLSTIRHADKIIVLKGGVVAEQGTHDELLRLDGVYAELYRTQVQPAAPASA
ncbi:MAG: ABC transporter ATP-binding protein [Candidatus Accumulibacter phosphatis]|uniref:ABC transporter ATP-binding protein n=1 Tax=Candidatus Accumulibacter phosphatis TaxID=327160 RepID=UPI001A5658FA|nr:ABC transporter ATP-binding protein [Candidatus Accumulibacter phosphatis]